MNDQLGRVWMRGWLSLSFSTLLLDDWNAQHFKVELVAAPTMRAIPCYPGESLHPLRGGKLFTVLSEVFGGGLLARQSWVILG